MAIDQISNEFDELNALLADAMQNSKAGLEVKAAREKLKKGGLSAAEREADAARIAEWESKHEWRAEANVALFIETGCDDCGTYSQAFSHYMQRQAHRHLRESRRWVTTDRIMSDLPNEVVIQTKMTAMCEDCAPAKGWLIEQATKWEG